MNSRSTSPDWPLRRHDLVFVSGAAWRSLMRAREDLAGEPTVTGWVDRGWPLIARRPLPGEAQGVALGLPLPPVAGKRRIDIVVPLEAIVATAPPLALSLAISAAPSVWQPALLSVVALALRHGVKARVFGSLAWQVLTGMDYLTPSSDVDLLLPVRSGSDPIALAAELGAIERTAPMRLDGEIVREDGAAVNWRELYAGTPEVLVKMLHDVSLLPAECFGSEASTT